MGWSEQDEEEKQAFLAGIFREVDACADVCARLAEMMESGAGEVAPGERLRQAERMIRARKEITRI